MRFIAVRSLPLSQDTKEAWRYAGAIYPARGSSVERIISLADDSRADFILNLGSSKFHPTELERIPVLNKGMDIYPLLWPGLSRTLFDDLMPPRPTVFPADVWIKTPGFGGRGKFHKLVSESMVLPHQWDWQAHVEGEEWRILTVGQKVVQQHRRHGGNGERTYEWVPQADTPAAIKDKARSAAQRVPGLNVIAWDLIVSEEGDVYIFEGNSCPGVNEATAQRIVSTIQETLELGGL
jgi:hypothetical protein